LSSFSRASDFPFVHKLELLGTKTMLHALRVTLKTSVSLKELDFD